MTKNYNRPAIENDERDFSELISALWQGKWIIIATTFVFSAVAVFYATNLPNVYKSEVTLAPVSEDAALKIPGQLGGLAAMAGVNLGGLGGGDKTVLALEILESRDFIGRFIENNDLFLPIMAAEGWNRSEDKLKWNPKVYDAQTRQWVRKVTEPYQAKPSTLETYEEFKKIFSVDQDKTSGMVTLSVEHFSPFLAKNWAENLVKAINEEMRTRELSEAERSIAFLNSQITQTALADVRTMLFSLIEEQTKTVMLANVRHEYVFKTVDPAVVAERKAKPARAVIVVLIALLGLIFSSLFVLVKYFKRK